MGTGLVAIAVPIMALFGLRRLLIARWQDRSSDAMYAATTGPAPVADTAGMAA